MGSANHPFNSTLHNMNILLAVLVFLQVAYGGRVYEDEDIIVSGGYGGRPVSGYGERPVTGYGTRSSIAIKRPVVLHERPAVVHERPVLFMNVQLLFMSVLQQLDSLPGRMSMMK